MAVLVGNVFDHKSGALVRSEANPLNVKDVLRLVLLLRFLVLLLDGSCVLSVLILVGMGMLLAGSVLLLLLLPEGVLVLSRSVLVLSRSMLVLSGRVVLARDVLVLSGYMLVLSGRVLVLSECMLVLPGSMLILPWSVLLAGARQRGKGQLTRGLRLWVLQSFAGSGDRWIEQDRRMWRGDQPQERR